MKRRLHIFISYRRIHNGAPCAYILAERLRVLGIEVFYDNQTLHDYNSNYKRRIRSDIDAADYVLVLLQKGCMREKRNDVYLEEIRYAIEKLGVDKLLMLPLDETFDWNTEKTPQDIEYLQEHNNLHPLRLSDVDGTIMNILKRCKIRPEISAYAMREGQRQSAIRSGCRAVVQRTGDIYRIDLEERWRFASRISLVSIGLGALCGWMSSKVEQKYKEGVSFRLMSVDPTGESARDAISTKLNTFSPQMHNDYLHNCQKLACNLFDSITKEYAEQSNEVEYRVTPHHLTCSIQIVEHDVPAYDYVFVEYYAICATRQDQNENRAIMAYRGDPNFDYYCRQFETVWASAHLVYRKDMGDVELDL